ncbi:MULTISPECIES: ABC transporter permease [unclassified Rhodococcus (in: high G+C Gram-positive bacteria)]|uniref:ABC transporter permease n=1 Tax=unclassified Rhodococcus (in: high G+C Gram-positive bacteria) TaxID=192944 RepID=UPI0015C61821|nr:MULTISPECIES: ABC transporter permease [unclassified Rhodococcus (in: high G+C Gram-positive bacteria)]
MNVDTRKPQVDKSNKKQAELTSTRQRILVLAGRYEMIGILSLVLIGATVWSPDFWSATNIQNLLNANAAIGIVAVGMTFVILIGGFDLSVGAILGVGAVVYASCEGHMPAIVAIVVTVAVGAAAGSVNGLLITLIGVNPFVATIGTTSAFLGLALLYSNSNVYYLTTDSYLAIGSARMFGLQLQVWILLALLLVGGLVLAKTVHGRSVYAVGGNKLAARISGLPTMRLEAGTYVLSGAAAGLGGVITAALTGTAQADMGATTALDAITIVIVGGTVLMGGTGAMWNTAVGLLIIGTIKNVFDVNAVSPAIQQVATGSILIVAVAISVYSHRKNV